jgi:hypothetical protein
MDMSGLRNNIFNGPGLLRNNWIVTRSGMGNNVNMSVTKYRVLSGRRRLRNNVKESQWDSGEMERQT